MSKAIIIGSGPAGISAALYTARGNVDTTIISSGYGALEKAHKIENYYGLKEPISGKELHDIGISQAKALGCTIVEGEVLGLGYDGQITVSLKDDLLKADAVIISTGSSRKSPSIKGLADFEGRGVSYCATCDGFFYRDKSVVVIGNGEYALHEAMALTPLAEKVYILTNGQPAKAQFPENIIVIDKQIDEISGDAAVESISFKDGTALSANGIFVAMGSAGSVDLARKLGALIEGNKIIVDENMQTNIPGLFACGDCTGGLLQVSKAVADGAIAGTSTVKFLRNKK